MIHQLKPPIPVITPKGKALAHAMIDYGIEADLQWVCFQDSTGECWTWPNPKIRAQINVTQGRDYISPFYLPEDVALKKEGGYFCMECGGHNECDCEEEEEEDFETLYNEQSNEIVDQKNKLIEFREENKKIKSELKQNHDLLKQLYNDDQVHPNEREKVRQLLLKTDEFMDGYDGRLVNKN